MGTVKIDAAGVLVENTYVSDNANVGVRVANENVELRRVTSRSNGMLGVHATYADGLAVVGLMTSNNNLERYNTAPVSGGMKIGRTRGITVRDSDFSENLGPGLWFDESCYNARVVDNRMFNNAKHGMAFEISSLAVIADNVISGNLSTGMKINDATNIRVYNNTIASNGKNVDLVQDYRRATNLGTPGHDPRQSLPDPTVTWLLGNVAFMNNLVGKPTGAYGLNIRDYSKARSASQMGIQLNGNQFNAQPAGSLFVWGATSSSVVLFKTVATLESSTGQGPGNGDTASSTFPVGLPSDIAALIGQSAGERHIGAF
jgi:hypothetical protein